MSLLNEPRCRPDLPLTIVLGAGAVRGMAHIGVLEVLHEAGFHVAELIGTSVGALIVGFQGAIGRDLNWIREHGLGVRSLHLLTWAVIRRLPESRRRRYQRWAGGIPSYMDDLVRGSFATMHHGLARIGIVSYDLISKRQVVCHNVDPIFTLQDAVRGAVAVPGLFQPWKCVGKGARYKLVDGGTRDRLPVDVVFEPPFQPSQVLTIDISTRADHRQESMTRLATLRARFPQIPLDCICVDTLKGRSVVYGHSHSMGFLEAGRRAAREYLSRATAVRDLTFQSAARGYDVAGAGTAARGHR